MFRFEKEMLPIIKSGLGKKYVKAKCFQEFNSGNGISDLTFATLNNNVPSIRIGNYAEMFYLINYFNRKGKKINPENLISKNNLNSKILLNLINKLLIGKYITPLDNSYRIEKIYHSPVKKIISVEAKLSNWKDGFYQAQRYKCFSHKTYLALSSKYVKNVDLDLFAEKNIGLICVDQDHLDILIEPSFSLPNDLVAFHHLSETLA